MPVHGDDDFHNAENLNEEPEDDDKQHDGFGQGSFNFQDG